MVFFIQERIAPQSDDKTTGVHNDAFAENESLGKGNGKVPPLSEDDQVEGSTTAREADTNTSGNEDEVDYGVAKRKRRRKTNIMFGVDERPPWYTSILLGFQVNPL